MVTSNVARQRKADVATGDAVSEFCTFGQLLPSRIPEFELHMY